MGQDNLVLVTGVTGFLGMHCVLALLEKGYRVRGTIRSISRQHALRDKLSEHTDKIEGLDLVETDLIYDQGWEDAVMGCRYVLHVASPFPASPPENEDDLVIPARDGTLRVLKASIKEKVERVVMTSSVVAITGGHPQSQRAFTEEDWSDLDGEIGPYPKSKTLAEKAAWEYVNNLPEGKKLELSTINPGYILGPVLDDVPRTSNIMHLTLMRRQAPGIARMKFNMVDVRDVAAAHILAMETPEAAGQRFLCVAEEMWLPEIAKVLDKRFRKDGYKIPTLVFPSFLVRLIALFDKTVRENSGSLDRDISYDTGKIRQVLGWQPRPIEDTLIEMGESLIRQGLV